MNFKFAACSLLLNFAAIYVYRLKAAGNLPEILTNPLSQVVPLDSQKTTVTFVCNTRSSIAEWQINGSYILNQENYRRMGFIFETQSENGFWNLSLTVPITVTFNNTMVFCEATTRSTTVYSQQATLIVHSESPFEVNPMVRAQNDTSLTLFWSPIFLWPRQSPVVYNISIVQAPNGSTVFNTMVSISSSTDLVDLYISKFDISVRDLTEVPESCSTFHFMITPIEEETASVTAGYPIKPSDSDVAVLNSTVFFYQNASPAYVLLYFQLPYVCDYQELSYTVTFEGPYNGTFSMVMIGPNHHNGSGIVRVEANPGLEGNQNYSAQVFVETIAGNATSLKHFFDTKFKRIKTSTEDSSVTPTTNVDGAQTLPHDYNDATVTIIAISVGFSILLVMLVTILSACMCIQCRKQRPEREQPETTKKGKQVMVQNPIYDGPIYDTIHQEFDVPLHPSNPTKPPLPSPHTHVNKDTPRYLNDPQINNKKFQNGSGPPTNTSICPRSFSVPVSIAKNIPHPENESQTPNNDKIISESLIPTTSIPSDNSTTADSFKVGENEGGTIPEEAGYTVMQPVSFLSNSLNGGWGEISAGSFKVQN